MLKLILDLLILLAICVVAGIVRKGRGGTFFPAPENIDGNPELEFDTGRFAAFSPSRAPNVDDALQAAINRRPENDMGCNMVANGDHRGQRSEIFGT